MTGYEVGLWAGTSYKRFRADGWPYCPQCDEDELYSLANPATVETIVGCYRCNWRAWATKGTSR